MFMHAGAYERLRTEIQAQANVLRQQLQQFDDGGFSPFLRHANNIIVVAEGSSANAATMAAPWLSHWLEAPIQIKTPDAYFNMRHIGAPPHDVILVSQSGQSKSVLAVAQALNPPTLSLTNQPDSPLAKMSRTHWWIAAGPEESIAATKTVTATWLTLLLGALASTSDTSDHTLDRDTRRAALEITVNWLEQWLLNSPAITALQLLGDRLKEAQHVWLLSKGMPLLALPEMALKLIELSALVVNQYGSESVHHGPKAQLDALCASGIPVTLLCLWPANEAQAMAMAEELEPLYTLTAQYQRPFVSPTQHDICPISFASKNAGDAPTIQWLHMGFANQPLSGSLLLPTPDPSDEPAAQMALDMIQVLLPVVATQCLGMAIAQSKGIDPNPRALQKIVNA